MSNPAVINLTSTRIGGKEFKIEDNLGEAIHIHFGEIRIDLTVHEFEEISHKAEYILDQMDDLIPQSLVSWRTLNPIFLQNPKNTDIVFRLEKADIVKIKVKDILVDSYIRIPLLGKILMYRSVKYSRIVKALNGEGMDNDKYLQLNTLFETNAERVKSNLDLIREKGYPYNDQYIIINRDNMIIDGQHRAACLYYLFGGEYEIPVMRWEFSDPDHIFFPEKKSIMETALRVCLSAVHRRFIWMIKSPFYIISRIKRHHFRKRENIKQTSNCSNAVSQKGSISNLDELILLLKENKVDFLVVDKGFGIIEEKADLSLLVHRKSQKCFEQCMKQNGFFKQESFRKDMKYLYSLERDDIYSNGLIRVHTYNQLFCKSVFENAMVPLEQLINQEVWNTKVYNENSGCFQAGKTITAILYIVQAVFFEKGFSLSLRENVMENIVYLKEEEGRRLLQCVFYRFTDRLLQLISEERFDDILDEYISFADY